MDDPVIYSVQLGTPRAGYRGARVRDGIPEVTIDGQNWAIVEDTELAAALLGQVPRDVREAMLTSYFTKLVPPGASREDFDRAIESDRAMQQQHIIALLLQMTPGERMHVLYRFCGHCGVEQRPEGEMPCQCWNDE